VLVELGPGVNVCFVDALEQQLGNTLKIGQKPPPPSIIKNHKSEHELLRETHGTKCAHVRM
jgi:hypothetical protein